MSVPPSDIPTAAARDVPKEPWLGLVPYLEADHDLFYGREQDALDLLRSIRREVLTVLFGRSGTGKSSLLRAGVFPRLREENFLPVWIRLDHSGTTPYFGQVRGEIAKAVKKLGLEEELLNPALWHEADDLWEYLHRAVFWDERSQPLTPVLVFDQFEELFTIGRNPAEIAVFLDELADLAEDHIPKRVRDLVESGAAKLPAAYEGRHYKLVISLREDFVSRLDGLSKSMPSVMHNWNSLQHMTGSQALEVVLKPGGDLVDPEVAERIVGFVSAANQAEPATAQRAAESSGADDRQRVVEPAILSLVCRELNLRRIKEGEHQITLKQVQTSSNQIIEDFYERSLEGLDPSDRVFIENRLVTPSGFRTAVPMEEAEKAGLSKDEIELLIKRRLLRKEKRLGIPHIELTHDVLTKVVTRSRDLRQERDERLAEAKSLKDEEEAREQERERREMEQKREREAKDQEREREAKDQEREREAKDQERERKAKEREQEVKSQRARRARWIATGVAAVFGALAAIALISRSQAQKQSKVAEVARKEANARSLALNALEASRRDQELGLLLSIESGIVDLGGNASRPVAREIEQSLRTSLRESLLRQRFAGHTSKVYSVDFSKDGERLLTSADAPDSTARIWSVRTGKEIAKLVHPAIPGPDEKSPQVSCARFSPDGRRIVTATYEKGGNVCVWDAENLRGEGSDHPQVISKPLGVYEGHLHGVAAVAVSPDGRWVASGGHDNEIQIWDLETRINVEHLAPLTGHTKRIRSLIFSRDGNQLLSAANDGTAILWNLENALPPSVASGNSTSSAIQDSPSVSPLPATSTQPVPRLILNARPQLRDPENLQSADISPSGNHLATGGNDRLMRVWDARTGTQLVAEAHPDSVWKVLFIDDMRLVSICNDSTIRFWDLVPPVRDESEAKRSAPGAARVFRLVSSQRGHEGRIRDVAISPDKRFIATAGDDHSVRRWVLPPGGELAVLGGSGRDFFWSADLGRVKGADGKPDTPVVFGGTAKGEIKAIELLTELPLEKWGATDEKSPRHTAEIRFLSISPDGSRLVTASADQTVIVWETSTGKSLFQWIGHQKPHGGSVYHARFSPDGKRIVSASSDGTAQVWKSEGLAKDARPELILIPGEAEYSDADLQDHLQELALKLKDHADPASKFVWGKMSDTDRSAMIAAMTETGADGLAPLKEVLRKSLNNLVSGNRLKDEPAFHNVARCTKTRWLEDTGTGTIKSALANRFLLDDAFPGLVKSFPHAVADARFSDDGGKIVTADFERSTATIWDAHDGRSLMQLRDSEDLENGHGDNVMSAAFSHDGSRVVTACMDGYCRLWDSKTGALLELIPHNVAVRSAEFSSDDTRILTSATDGVARIWARSPSQSSYLLHCELRGHTETVPEARLCDDGRYILTTGRDGTVRVSYTDPWDVYALATTRITRKLTMKEREQYAVTRPLQKDEVDYYYRKNPDLDSPPGNSKR